MLITSERVLVEARIAPHAVRYQVLINTFVFVACVVTIPLLPILIPIAHWYWTRYYMNLRVILTTRDLKVQRGIFVREEKAIPLEKITDLAVVQGPIMRRLDLKGIKVETAGQSSGASALVNIVGLAHTDAFRDTVLRQRDRITDGVGAASVGQTAVASGGAAGADQALLEAVTEIRDVLRRIESGLAKRDAAETATPE